MPTSHGLISVYWSELVSIRGAFPAFAQFSFHIASANKKPAQMAANGRPSPAANRATWLRAFNAVSFELLAQIRKMLSSPPHVSERDEAGSAVSHGGKSSTTLIVYMMVIR